MSEKKYSAYLCFRRAEKGQIRGILLHTDLGSIDEWRSRTTKSEHDTPSETGEADARQPEDRQTIDALISAFVQSMSSYRELIFATSALAVALKHGYLTAEVYDSVNTKFDLIEDAGEFRTYGVPEGEIDPIRRSLDRYKSIERGMDVLPEATLLSLVASFDSYISDLARILMRRRPEVYEKSQKSLSIREILSMSSFEDVIDKVVGDEIDNLMRGSHAEQVKFFEEHFSVKISASYERWPSFIEIFERRNLIAHGGSRVNKIYVNNCAAAGFDVKYIKIGDELTLSQNYLTRAITTLTEFGVLLMFVMWRKHFTDDAATYSKINDLTYEMIRNRRFRLAERILGFSLFKQTFNIEDQLRRMMIVNLANAKKNLKDSDGANLILSREDWSATADKFRICVSSIRGDIDAVVSLMPRVAQSNEISKSEFRDWPAFSWVRDDDKFKDKFFEIYGEPISSKESVGLEEKKETEITEDSSANGPEPAAEPECDPTTVH